MPGVIRIYWVYRERRQAVKSVVKVRGSTPELQLKLPVLSTRREAGIHGVAVKCLDIMKTTDREGRFPECN